jgi:L-ribulose-5-phosphate 3-epimerase
MPIPSAWALGLYEKALPAAWSWDQRLTATADAGYSFAEISIDVTDERLARLDWPASEKADLRRAIAASGVPIQTMCLSAHRKYSLGSRVAATRERGLEIMRQAIDFSVDVGVRIVQVPGYDVFDEQPGDAETVARFMDGIHQAEEWAAQACVMLALENVDVPLSESITATMDIVRQVNSPWLQIYPDMANSAAAGYDPAIDLACCADHLVAIHTKDGLPRTIRGVPFRTGLVQFEAVFHTLADIGFIGPFVVEMWADMDKTGDPVGAVRAARQLVIDLIENTY